MLSFSDMKKHLRVFSEKLRLLKFPHFIVGIFLVIVIISAVLSARLSFASIPPVENSNSTDQKSNSKNSNTESTTIPTHTPTPVSIISTQKQPWGVAEQIDEHTWTMKVGQDKEMSTPNEAFLALNVYRNRKGAQSLQWDEKLAELALKRANTFISIGKLDGHSGFNEYFKNEENVRNIGFYSTGENSSFGYRLEGVHLIEWVFAADRPHDDNQSDPTWTHVGIGINGTAVDVIFAKERI